MRQTALVTALALLAAPLGVTAAESLKVPFEYHKLDNGLKVVLSKDTTAPTATVTVYYNIGFRIEPKGRTGFAHLFEHLMFQGSNNLGKMEFAKLIEKNGGVINGSTRFDFTNYFQVVPANTVETVLWAEADRMKGLAIDQSSLTNQQGVVKNEVKVNVLNQPYGGFPWLDMPIAANTNWYNAHNFYGDLAELDAATLEDAKKFFETYYAPNNAVVVVSGDIDPAQTLAWIRKYFGSIKASALPPRPDISEPRQEQEKRAVKEYLEAPRPAIAVAYHAPKRMTAEYFALGLIDQILLQGKDSRLYQALVQEKGYTDDVAGGINAELGNLFDINGPTFFQAYLFHDKTTPPAAILDAFDAEVEKLRTTPIDQATLDLAKVKARSWLYGQMEDFFGFGRANLLASFALFDDDPGKINTLEGEFEKVTPELIMKTAQEYLREVWLGDLTAQLMREGTATKTGPEISLAAARMGGQVNINVGVDTASVTGSALSEFAPDLAKLVADLALHPKFPAGELDRLKADNLRRLSIAKSNPQQMATEKFRAVLYGNHPYGRVFPTEAQMKGYTLAQAKAFYEANWAASRARLYVVGRFDAAAAEATVRSAFSSWKKGTISHPPVAKPRADRAVHIVDRPGAVQTTLIVGLPTIDASHPDAIALSVTNSVLGGYFSSRMTANLRESKGYTYSPFSAVQNRYRDATWAQNADVTTTVTGASLKEIFFEIDRLQAEPPTEAELESAKNYMLGTFVLRNSDRAGIIAQLEFINFHGLPADYLNTYVGRVRAVTPAMVQQMTQKYIDDTKTAIIAVGDRKQIEDQVRPYGPIGSTPR